MATLLLEVNIDLQVNNSSSQTGQIFKTQSDKMVVIEI